MSISELMEWRHHPPFGSDVFDTAMRIRESSAGLVTRWSTTTMKRPEYWSYVTFGSKRLVGAAPIGSAPGVPRNSASRLIRT
jgi:hypothetical protein